MSAATYTIREALDWQKSLGSPSWTTAGKTVDDALAALARLEAAREAAARLIDSLPEWNPLWQTDTRIVALRERLAACEERT